MSSAVNTALSVGDVIGLVIISSENVNKNIASLY